jgi:transposase-like protein
MGNTFRVEKSQIYIRRVWQMPWKETSVMEERYRFVLKAYKSQESFTQICRRFGISSKTGYKWLNRFEKSGAAGLDDRPTVAKNVRNRTDEKVQNRLLRLKDKHKTWKAK